MLRSRNKPSTDKNDIFEAVQAGDVVMLRRLLWAWGIPDMVDRQGATPLHHAAANGFVEGIQLLLKHKAKIGARDLTGATPLHWAARARCEASVNELVNAGADLEALDHLGLTPFNPTPPDIPGEVARVRKARSSSRRRVWLIGIVVTLLAGYVVLHVVLAVVFRADIMYMSARGGSIRQLKLCLFLGVDPNTENRDAEFPIEGAVEGDSVEALELLLEAGAKYPIYHASRVSGEMSTLLHLAASRGSLKCFEYLMARYPDMVFEVSDFGDSPLHRLNNYAASRNWDPNTDVASKMIELLLAAGLDVDVRGENGRTPLARACAIGNDLVVPRLIKAGAEVNVKDDQGHTPLHLAVAQSSVQSVRTLIENGARIEELDDQGRTPLLHVASLNLGFDPDNVKYLLDAGAGITRRDNDGKAALHLAAERGHTLVVKYIVEAGADISHRDSDGKTALHLATERGRTHLVEYMIKAGADIGQRDNTGRTALHYAVLAEDEATIEILMKAGADASAVDNFGATPYSLSYRMPWEFRSLLRAPKKTTP